MAFHPTYGYRRNLEKIGRDIEAGPWRVSAYLDLVSEKRFLLFKLKSRHLVEVQPTVLSYRTTAASASAPSSCPGILHASVDRDRIEILTPHFEIVSPTHLGDVDLELLFDTMIRTLDRFERHRFFASDLYLGAIGRDGEGHFYLLPNAYVLPYPVADGAATTATGRLSRGRRSGRPVPGPGSALGDEVFTHVELLGKFIARVRAALPLLGDSTRSGGSDFPTRLARTSNGLDSGSITDLREAYRSLFGKSLTEPGDAWDGPLGGERDDSSCAVVASRLIEALNAGGGVLVVKGEGLSGKSDTLRRTARRQSEMAGIDVAALDEWDLFTRLRKTGIPKSKAPSRRVWLIDDIEEKALVYSPWSQAMLEAEGIADHSFVLSVAPERASQETLALLAEFRTAWGENYHEEALPAMDKRRSDLRMSGMLQSILRRLDPNRRPLGRGAPSDLLAELFERLEPEEKHLLELVSAARFSLPLDLVISAFPESGHDTIESIHRLAALNLLQIAYRHSPHGQTLSVFLSISGGTLRRLIYQSIPTARIKNLHRTVAVLSEQIGSIPTFFLLYHLLQAEERELAAKYFVSYLKENKSEKQHPYLLSLCKDLTEKKLLQDLPLSDQILALNELGREYLIGGKTGEAERLLLEAKALIEGADSDQKLKNAQLLSDTYRLLADRWEARGEFKRALDLLSDARDGLQSALSIPEQAQLLNDVGWLEYRLGDYEKSMESCRLSLNTLNANQYPTIVAQALNLMGVVHFNTSRYDEAISYYEQSAYLRERSGDMNALAGSYNNLALAYQTRGDYEKALDYYNKSLDIKKQQSNKAGMAAGYLNLALLYLDAHNFKEAEAKCKESLAISEELGNVQLRADNYSTLGDIAFRRKDYKTAEQHYKESLKLSLHIETLNEQMGALRRLSTLYLKLKRYDDARKHAEKAAELAEHIGSRYESAQIHTIIGDLELEQKRSTEALDHYEKAASLYTTLSKYRLGAKVLAKIGLIHAESGNLFESKHYLDRAQDFVRSDIGQELPEEYVSLQKALKTRPADTRIVGMESQKLLMAFYDLSTLSDYAHDRDEILRRIMDVIKQIVDPDDCYLAIKADSGRFILFDSAGERRPMSDDELAALFRKTLLVGGLLDSKSPDAANLARPPKLPKESAFVSIPLKAMGEELGCLLLYIGEERLPLPKETVNFLTSLGKQIAGNLRLMLYIDESFLKEEILEKHTDLSDIADEERHRYENLIGKSEPMKKIFRTLDKIKNIDSGILIFGESGTGKSVLARAIHYNSPRRNRPFMEIHCAQIPYNLLESELFGHERGAFTGAVQRKLGLCEIADGGTVFLDDINAIPVETQTKLLHFLESKSFLRLGGTRKITSDVRIVAASNEDLDELCKEGKFREDLYFRLKVILIELPPLRERKEDMIAIALEFLKRSCAEKNISLKTLSPETIQLFQKAPWRGNVRELQNVLERVVLLSEDSIITPASLPDDFLKEVSGTSKRTHRKLEALIQEIVEQGNYSEGNPLIPLIEAILAKKMVEHVESKSRAAGLLGITKPTLYARLKDYDKSQ